MSLLNAFTNQMENLSKEMCELYPKDADLKLGHNMIVLLKKTNPRKLYDLYIEYATNFREKIDKEDESFFITHDFKGVADKNGNGEYTFTLAVKLKEYWHELSPNNKKTTWKYFHVLNKLSDKIKEG